jgi:hypothetical protein
VAKVRAMATGTYIAHINKRVGNPEIAINREKAGTETGLVWLERVSGAIEQRHHSGR